MQWLTNQIVLFLGREQFDLLAIAINSGTNLPSVATPNGQAAFLFLLTSSVAPLLGLSYLRMVPFLNKKVLKEAQQKRLEGIKMLLAR